MRGRLPGPARPGHEGPGRRVGRACVLARAAAVRLGGRAGDSKRVERACVLHACGCCSARTRYSCVGPTALQERQRLTVRKPRALQAGPPRSPWLPRHALGRPASRGGSRAWQLTAPAFNEFGDPSLLKRLNLFKGKQHTKYSLNQILFSPGLGLHSGLSIWGLLG